MEMRSELEANEAYVEKAVAAAPVRPTRPNRPNRSDGAKRSARPMLLTTLAEKPAATPEASLADVAPARPVRPVRPATAERPVSNDTAARPARPQTQRRARVLEPDQIAASKGEEYVPPSSTARDAMLGAPAEEPVSKVGAILQSVQQIVAGLKKKKGSDEAPKADGGETPSKIGGVLAGLKRSKSEPVEAAEDMPTSKVSAIVSSLRKLPMALKKSKPEPAVEVEGFTDEVATLEQSLDAQSADFDGMRAVDPAFIPAKPSMMARFDTPLMGVLAAVAVSFVGLISASALFG